MHSNVTNVIETPSSLSPSPSNSSSTNASSINNYGNLTEPTSCANYFQNPNVNHNQSHQQLNMISPVMPNSSNSAVVSTNNSLTNGFNNGLNAYNAPINSLTNHSISATNTYSPSCRNSIANTDSKGLPTSQLIESTNSSVLAHNSHNISSSLFFKIFRNNFTFFLNR
jgi:hypothetical protein